MADWGIHYIHNARKVLGLGLPNSRVKSDLVINKSTMAIENNKEALAMLKREYRSPYKHPFSS